MQGPIAAARSRGQKRVMIGFWVSAAKCTLKASCRHVPRSRMCHSIAAAQSRGQAWQQVEWHSKPTLTMLVCYVTNVGQCCQVHLEAQHAARMYVLLHRHTFDCLGLFVLRKMHALMWHELRVAVSTSLLHEWVQCDHKQGPSLCFVTNCRWGQKNIMLTHNIWLTSLQTIWFFNSHPAWEVNQGCMHWEINPPARSSSRVLYGCLANNIRYRDKA